MKKLDSGFINRVGGNDYHIYLVVKEKDEFVRTDPKQCEYTDTGILFDPKKFDLWCEAEIYALAWYQIFLESIDKYVRGDLE